jgi:hypothetical protein
MTNNRIDLSDDFSGISDDLLKDVQAATAEVKKRKETIAAQEAREAQAVKSKKTSLILVAVGTVLVLLISYWIVFARSDEGTSGQLNAGSGVQTPPAAKVIVNPGVTQNTGTTPPAYRSGGGAAGQGSQVVEHPPDEYERPTDDPGM